MKRDFSDFMLEEYDHIATAYFGLQNQLTEWFKAYLTLVGLPLTVLAAVLRFGGGTDKAPYPRLGELPDVVSGLLFIVAILGLLVTTAMVSIRMEMILYARTINAVRRYFGESTQARRATRPLKRYLVLPTTDAEPPFYEMGGLLFWQVLMSGALDAALMLVAIKSLAQMGWLCAALLALIFGGLHLWVYVREAQKRRRGWEVQLADNLGPLHL